MRFQALTLVAFVLFGLSGASPAQEAAVSDPEAVARGLAAFKEGGCRACHGWAAHGVREGEAPHGPSIRATQLTPAQMREVIQCGRIGTPMPYFDWQAYNFDKRCYGLDRFSMQGIEKPMKGRVNFSAQQLDDLVAYLASEVVGRGPEPTLEECEAFFGAGSESCSAFR